jgi:hypothetical protein
MLEEVLLVRDLASIRLDSLLYWTLRSCRGFAFISQGARISASFLPNEGPRGNSVFWQSRQLHRFLSMSASVYTSLGYSYLFLGLARHPFNLLLAQLFPATYKRHQSENEV